MARNSTLQKLLQDLRAEIGASGNPAHNSSVRDAHINVLQRTQELLWEAHDWPHLRVKRIAAVQDGQRYYATPADLPIDRLEEIRIRVGDSWRPTDPSVLDSHYLQFDSFADERSWPVQRWQIHEDEKIELWPVPDRDGLTTADGAIQFTGIRALRPLVKDDDRADLDDRLIVLSAAGEYLTDKGSKSAPLKLRAAQQRLKTVLGNNSKVKQFQLFGAR